MALLLRQPGCPDFSRDPLLCVPRSLGVCLCREKIFQLKTPLLRTYVSSVNRVSNFHAKNDPRNSQAVQDVQELASVVDLQKAR